MVVLEEKASVIGYFGESRDVLARRKLPREFCGRVTAEVLVRLPCKAHRRKRQTMHRSKQTPSGFMGWHARFHKPLKLTWRWIMFLDAV
jgi:hypothetical protein